MKKILAGILTLTLLCGFTFTGNAEAESANTLEEPKPVLSSPGGGGGGGDFPSS